MRTSKWTIVLLVIAVAAVVVAKERSRRAPSTEADAAARQAPRESAADVKWQGPLPGSSLADCLKSGLPTMADFGRGWCKPCKAMVPVLEQAAQTYDGKANVVFVELGEHPDLGREYRIMAMPTQIFFDSGGQEVTRHVGYLDSQGIDARLAEMGIRR
jgi:thioredoxin 1